MPSPSATKCTYCNKPKDEDIKLKKCSVCNVTFYCSPECQREHWPSHKDECTETACLALFSAIQTDDIDTVKRLVKTKRVLNGRVDYTQKDDQGTPHTLGKWTGLHQCVREKKPESMKILIENGPKLEIKDVDGDTPTFMAATSQDSQLIKILLDAGSNPNAQAGDGWTCIMMAARDGLYETTKYLLEAGADVYLGRDMFGRTVVDMAAFQANGQGVRAKVDESFEDAIKRYRRVHTLLAEHVASRW
jgi:ankyrin repeat protein